MVTRPGSVVMSRPGSVVMSHPGSVAATHPGSVVVSHHSNPVFHFDVPTNKAVKEEIKDILTSLT